MKQHNFEQEFNTENQGGGGPETGGGEFISPTPIELFVKNPGSIDLLTNHVAEGGNLLDFCKLHKVGFAFIKRWLNASPEYLALYEEAKSYQKEYVIEKTLRELDRISHFDMRTIFDENNKPKPPSEWGDDAASVIAGIEVETIYEMVYDNELDENVKTEVGNKYKIKVWDKTKTLKDVASILDLLGANKNKGDDAAIRAAGDLLNVVNRMIDRKRGGILPAPAKQAGGAESSGGLIIPTKAERISEEVGPQPEPI